MGMGVFIFKNEEVVLIFDNGVGGALVFIIGMGEGPYFWDVTLILLSV